MDDRTTIHTDSVTDEAYSHSVTDGGDPCTKPFSLHDLERGHKDKLGNKVEDILWIGTYYAIYRSEKGVYVQFSDCPKREADQRQRFADLCPELCELRYLTRQMRPSWIFRSIRRDPSSLYEHNIAQAMMLVMEGKLEPGKRLAQHALDMAVQRVTNDNTVRYFGSCLLWWLVSVIALGAVLPHEFHSLTLQVQPFFVAGIAGATGAVLSVATRLEAFKLRPCNQSNMNYWMSGIRVGIGVVAGAILLLLEPTILSDTMKHLVPQGDWQPSAVLGLIGGLAERFVPNLLLRTIGKVDSPIGTPAQAVRSARGKFSGKLKLSRLEADSAKI
jgi:hypothetical protein